MKFKIKTVVSRSLGREMLFLLVIELCMSMRSSGVNCDIDDNYIMNNITAEMERPRRKCDFEIDASDLYLSTPEIIMKSGYPAEIHHAVSEDGYINEMHRIPAPGRPVIMIFHGMLMTSREWFLNCDGRSLPLKLATAGYDVWLLNSRGNHYSQKHVNLTTSDAKYWSYSVDEIAKYDLPALIDYTLEATGQKKVSWLGWSLGSAVLMALMSERPEYNAKIEIFFSLGTVAYVGHTKSPVFRLWSLANKIQDRAITWLTKGAFLPKIIYPFLRNLMPAVCVPEARSDRRGICSSLISLLDGSNPDQINPAFFPFVMANFPSTVSIKTLGHWFQWINGGRFTHYDYGMLKNLRRYGTIRPPEYDLSKFTAPVVNFWSDNDWISTPQDVQRTMDSLPNVIHNIRVNMTSWNHFDFGMAKDADIYVYNPIVEILNYYTQNQNQYNNQIKRQI